MAASGGAGLRTTIGWSVFPRCCVFSGKYRLFLMLVLLPFLSVCEFPPPLSTTAEGKA